MTTQEERMRVAIEMLGAERNIPLQDAAAKWERLYPADKEACFRMADVALSLPARVAVERPIELVRYLAVLNSRGEAVWTGPAIKLWDPDPSIREPAAPAPAADPVREALRNLVDSAKVLLDGRTYLPGSVAHCELDLAVRAAVTVLVEAKQ